MRPTIWFRVVAGNYENDSSSAGEALCPCPLEVFMQWEKEIVSPVGIC